jgi:hypothetical protein
MSTDAVVKKGALFLVSGFLLGYRVVCRNRHLAAKKHQARRDLASRMA